MELKDLGNKKIVFFIAETIPSGSGSGIMAHRFARFLTQYAKNIKTISFNYRKKLVGKEIIDGVHIKRIPYYNQTKISKLLSLPGLILQYLYEGIRSDYIFIYGSYMPGYESILFLSYLNKPIVFISTLEGDDDIKTILSKNSTFIQNLRKKLFKKIFKYWAINRNFENYWKSYFPKHPISVLSSQGVSSDVFQPVNAIVKEKLRERLNIDNDAFVVLSAGYLINRKGYKQIFESLATLDSQILYIIAGAFETNIYHRSSRQEAKEMYELKILANEILGNKITLLGSQDQMQKIYPMADIFLHASSREGFPNVVLEAMSCGLPVIFKHLDGMDYIVKNNYNVIVINEYSEIISAILKIKKNRDLKNMITENARQTICSQQTYVEVAKRIFNQHK